MSAVIQLADFRGHQVRVTPDADLQGRKVTVVPVNDVADALQYDREVIRKLVTRKKMIGRHSTTSIMEAVDGKQREQLCLSYEGVIGVVLNIEPDRIKDPQRRQWVEDFQEWAVTTLTRIMRGEVAAPGPTQEYNAFLVECRRLAEANAQLADSNTRLVALITARQGGTEQLRFDLEANPAARRQEDLTAPQGARYITKRLGWHRIGRSKHITFVLPH